MGWNPSLVCPDNSRPVLRGPQRRALLGHPLTHPDVQVLEEDEECLSDQLELPRREAPVYLRRQSRNRHSAFRSEMGDCGQAGVGRVGAQRWSQRASRRLSCWAGWRGRRGIPPPQPPPPSPSPPKGRTPSLHTKGGALCLSRSPRFHRTSTTSSLSEKLGKNCYVLWRCFPRDEGPSERASDETSLVLPEWIPEDFRIFWDSGRLGHSLSCFLCHRICLSLTGE